MKDWMNEAAYRLKTQNVKTLRDYLYCLCMFMQTFLFDIMLYSTSLAGANWKLMFAYLYQSLAVFYSLTYVNLFLLMLYPESPTQRLSKAPEIMCSKYIRYIYILKYLLSKNCGHDLKI